MLAGCGTRAFRGRSGQTESLPAIEQVRRPKYFGHTNSFQIDTPVLEPKKKKAGGKIHASELI
jgi:hypothetical protein